MRYIDIAVPKFDDDDALATEKPSARQAPHPAVSFRQQPVEEYTLDDTHSILSHQTHEDKDDGSSVDEKGGEKFFEPHDDTTDTQRQALQQVAFQFSFSVGKLQTSLFKSISPTEERALATAALEGFGLTFNLRKWDTSVDLFLRSVTLAMIEQGQSRRPLLSSANDGNDEELKLLQVRYMKVQKDSPEFMTVHEGVDQSVDVDLSTFRISAAPEPILNLYDFIMTTFVPSNESAGTPVAGGESQIAPSENIDAEQVEQGTDKLRVRVKVISASGKRNIRERLNLLTIRSFSREQ